MDNRNTLGSVRDLQYMLNQIAMFDHSMPRLAVDGIFGERTLEAVMIFQRDYHPPVTGIVDLGTWSAIAQAYQLSQLENAAPPSLHIFPGSDFSAEPNSQSGQSMMLQAMFSSLSHIASNFSSQQTDDALHENIRRLQLLSARPETGILDRPSWAALAALYRALVTRALPS